MRWVSTVPATLPSDMRPMAEMIVRQFTEMGRRLMEPGRESDRGEVRDAGQLDRQRHRGRVVPSREDCLIAGSSLAGTFRQASSSETRRGISSVTKRSTGSANRYDDNSRRNYGISSVSSS